MALHALRHRARAAAHGSRKGLPSGPCGRVRAGRRPHRVNRWRKAGSRRDMEGTCPGRLQGACASAPGHGPAGAVRPDRSSTPSTQAAGWAAARCGDPRIESRPADPVRPGGMRPGAGNA
jgi:hypothetical protein